MNDPVRFHRIIAVEPGEIIANTEWGKVIIPADRVENVAPGTEVGCILKLAWSRGEDGRFYLPITDNGEDVVAMLNEVRS